MYPGHSSWTDSKTKVHRPEPVEGAEFALGATRLEAVLLGFLAIVGAVLLMGISAWFEWRSGKLIIMAGIIGLAGLFVILRYLVWPPHKRHLVIASDRVQLLQTTRGEDVVVAQVLYVNIAELSPRSDESGERLVVKLVDRNAAGTFDSANVISPNRDKTGHNLVIRLRLGGDLNLLTTALAEAITEWQSEVTS